MFDWELVVKSASAGHETTVKKWSSEHAPSEAELRKLCLSYSGGDKLSMLSVTFSDGGGYHPYIVTGHTPALDRIRHLLTDHVLMK